MKEEFEYNTEGYQRAVKWLESIKDDTVNDKLDGYSIVHYANDKYRRIITSKE